MATTLRLRDDLVWREIDDAIVTVSFVTGEYVVLDSVGSTIWRLIAADGRADAVIAGLLKAYDLDDATCRRELDDFVCLLGDHRLMIAETTAC